MDEIQEGQVYYLSKYCKFLSFKDCVQVDSRVSSDCFRVMDTSRDPRLQKKYLMTKCDETMNNTEHRPQ